MHNTTAVGAAPTVGDWLATYVGLLNDAFSLTDDEQFEVRRIVKMLLEALRVGGRPAPAVVPLLVRQEMMSGHFSSSLDRANPPPVRPVTGRDCVASAEAWRTPLEAMLLTAYPDLSPDEVLLMRKVFSDLLAALGVPRRAAAFFPESVLAAHREISDSVPEPDTAS